MGNTTTLLLLSFALLVSCGKETDRYVTDVDNNANVIATYMCDSSLPFADPILKGQSANTVKQLGKNPEITRFKGLGEISPDEFKHFIGPDMRLDQVMLRKEDAVAELLSFYMGDNTPERQNFIVENLVVEDDEI